MFDRLANATVRIVCGKWSGSGFHFLNEELILTNYHIVEPHLTAGERITAYTEDKASTELEVLELSPENKYDFAVLKAKHSLAKNREVLEPKEIDYLPSRGDQVAFSGFPHGISDLLVHRAFISGPFCELGFHVDGSINGGNSGGPIIDVSDGKVVGVVTARRMIGGKELDAISAESKDLQKYLDSIAGSGCVKLMGIDFSEFARLVARSLELMDAVIDANANSGIGIGYHIKFALEACQKLGY